MTERWLPVPRYEGLYEVSSEGRVRGLTRGKVLKSATDRDGYQKVSLSRDGKVRNAVIHRIVCEAFHGPAPLDKPLALHGIGGVGDNRPANLRWGTYQENALDRGRDGTDARGSQTHCISNHEFTFENTYLRSNGTRACRTCHRDRAREVYRSRVLR